jgi:serine/threonine protein kinase
MTPAEEDALDRIAMSISDGTPIAWDRERSEPSSDQSVLQELETLERIRDAHGGAADTQDDTDTDPRAGLLPLDGPCLFTWGPLRVLERVGGGSGGDVYRAYDPALQVEIALKLRRADDPAGEASLERFLSEARKLAKVRHPNVLIVHGADVHDGRAGLWTEFVRGTPLEDLIREHGLRSACEAAMAGLDICRALAAVHAAGLIHRDVKTSNVMREHGGRHVLMDFGTVVETPRGDQDWGGDGAGTPLFMAPEQLLRGTASETSDIYSLGVLLYRLVSGAYPVEARDRTELVRCHTKGTWVRLRDRRADLPLRFVQVVERAIHPDPARRYGSVGAMEAALAATLDHQGAATSMLAKAAIIGIVGGAMVLGGYQVAQRFWPPSKTEAGLAKLGSVTPPRAPISATFVLLRQAGRGEDTLRNGSTVKPGDRLSMHVVGSDSMMTYILNEDSDGNVFVLFPIPGMRPENPLAARTDYRLPGADGDSVYYWNVTSAGGEDHVVAIASRHKLGDIEEVLATLPPAKRGREVTSVRLPPGALQQLRGIGGLTSEPIQSSEKRRLLRQAIEDLAARGRTTGNITVWETTLRNPAP